MKARWIVSLLAVAGLTLGVAVTRAQDKDEENEVTIKLEECPAAVQATLKKEAGSGVIAEIEKETEDGKTLYEAEVKLDGKEWEIKVAEDGSLISKKLDDEEKDDKNAKDDK